MARLAHLQPRRAPTRTARCAAARPGARRALRLLAGWFLLPLALACSPGPRAERIVLVTIDTLRADHVGAYGRDPSPTPTLDALASAGARFDAAFAPTPLTLPSHATLLTGRDPHEHGVRHNGSFRLADDVPTLAESLATEGWGTAAFVGAYVLDRSFGLARGFEHYDDHMGIDGSGGGAGRVPERRGDLVVDGALAWLKNAPDRFLLWVHLYDPHAEYAPPKAYRSRFPHPYDGEIAFADAQIARLRDAVAARFPEGGTLWAITSDHGESLGEHGEATHAYGLYDATQRVPLLIEGAGVPAGSVFPGVVALRDLAPTLSAIAGVRSPEGATGRNLRPWLAAADTASSASGEAAYLETLATQLDWRWSPLLGIRTANHKYVRAPRPELYDLGADPTETTNVAATEPALVAELDAQLEARLASARPIPQPAALDADARARLEALGYVTRDDTPDPSELGRVGGVDPKDEIALVAKLQRANRLLGRQKPREALAELEGVENRGVEVALVRSRAALAAGRIELGSAAAREAAALAPESPRGWVLLGRIAEARRDLDAARAHYRHAAALGSGSGSPETGLGRVAEAEGDRDGAAAHYRAALEARLPDPEAHWRLAALLIEDRQFAAANAHHAATPRDELGRPEAAARVARAQQNAGRPKRANERLLAALFRQPDSIRLLRTQAELLEEQGHPDGALDALEKAHRLAPDHLAVRNELAWALARNGKDLERAEELARGTLKDAGGDPGAIDTLCAVLLARGASQEALDLAESAIPRAADAGLAFLHYRRAEALHALGRDAEAADALASARTAAEGRSGFQLDALGERVASLLGAAKS